MNLIGKIKDLLITLFGKVTSVPGLDTLLPLMSQDKKNSGTVINFSLIDQIGSCKFDVQVDDAAINTAINYYNGI